MMMKNIASWNYSTLDAIVRVFFQNIYLFKCLGLKLPNCVRSKALCWCSIQSSIVRGGGSELRALLSRSLDACNVLLLRKRASGYHYDRSCPKKSINYQLVFPNSINK